MAPRLALDIGATTVTARVGGSRGGTSCVLFDGAPWFPSAVCFESGGAGSGARAGREALALGAGDPSAFTAAPLDAILDDRLDLGGARRDPAELLMPVLSLVLAHARDVVPEPPESIACVVPLGTAKRLREPMRLAAQSLGLPEPLLVPEPVAAVLHATGGAGLAPGGTGVVIDAGGRSMEVTVLRGTDGGVPEVLANHVDFSLGGEAVDDLILRWLASTLDRENPPLAAAVRAETNRTLLADLRARVIGAKEELADAPEADIYVTTLRGHGSVRLTRGDLPFILHDWSVRARALVTRALAEAHLPADGSTGCFVIGGGASMPILRETLAPVGRMTFAHDPLTAAVDGALLADVGKLGELADMDETVTPVDVAATPPAPKPPEAARPRKPLSPFADVAPAAGQRGAGAAATPFAVPASFTKVWAGRTFAMAADDRGRVWQWGEMALARFLSPIMRPHPVPGLTPGGDVAAAGGGDSFGVVIDDEGTAFAWGDNTFGQLGLGGSRMMRTVVRPDLPGGVTAVSCGHSHVLAVSATGRVLSWGNPMGGRLGTGATWTTATAPPTEVPGITDPIVGVAAGRNHSLALAADGGVWGWGRDGHRQLGGVAGPGSGFPVKLPTAVPFTAIAAGSEFTLALDDEGGVWSWGRNNWHQLGLGAAVNPNLGPGAGRVGLPGPAARIFAGDRHAGAVLADGRLFTWGANGSGQAGAPAGLPAVPGPVQVAFPPDAGRITDAAAGKDFTVCVAESGRVYVLGGNGNGIFGNGSRLGQGHLPMPLTLG